MRCWRLTPASREQAALTGDGGLFGSARWHRQGVRIVYTSATLSLAALEVLVRASRWRELPDLVALEIDVPDRIDLRTIQVAGLEDGWRDPSPSAKTQELGMRWLGSGKTAVLAVPSAIIPGEQNFLLNPAHPDFDRIRVAGRERFSFDPRLAGKSR